MNARPADWKRMDDKDLRSVARLAEACRQDLYDNGRRHSNPDCGLTAKAAEDFDIIEIWHDACTRNGTHSERFGAFECRECGWISVGREDANECCTEADEPDRFEAEGFAAPWFLTTCASL